MNFFKFLREREERKAVPFWYRLHMFLGFAVAGLAVLSYFTTGEFTWRVVLLLLLSASNFYRSEKYRRLYENRRDDD